MAWETVMLIIVPSNENNGDSMSAPWDHRESVATSCVRGPVLRDSLHCSGEGKWAMEGLIF